MTVTNDREATCAERIAEHLESRADDVRKMLAASNGDRLCKHCGERITEETADDDDAATLGLVEGNDYWCHVEDITRRVCREGGNVLSGDDPVAEPDDDYTEDTLSEFGLGLSRKVLLRFDMSTGGPADWLEVVCEETKHTAPGYELHDVGLRHGYTTLDVERVVYHFADWFDHAEQDVTDGPMYELAEYLAEGSGQ